MLTTLIVYLLWSADFAFPDTSNGKIAAAYVAAFNSGDEKMYQQFEETNRAASSLAMRPMPERLAQYRKLRHDWGRLEPTKIVESNASDLSLAIKTTASKETLKLGFAFEKEAPHKLVSISIEMLTDGGDAAETSAKLTAEDVAATVAKLIKLLEQNYVFPDKVPAMASSLRKKAEAGEYDQLDSAAALARQLTDDLRAVCNDKHLGIRPKSNAPGGILRIPQDASKSNYGFERVEILPGNIGCIKLNGFSQQHEAQAPAAAAMAFVANCDALIFDLRDNGGGSPVMIKFLQSYLFSKRTHLNSFYDREGKKVEESWTSEAAAGKSLGDELPVYVLTSGHTFSGAEEFAYNLQCRKRGTIVGETTGGGAHPVNAHPLGEHLTVGIPFMRAENPITKANWEGVGVKPDIACPSDAALERALEDARKRVEPRRPSATRE
jgi:hypothetical protein